MKSLLAGLVLFGLALSVNAGDTRSTNMPQYVQPPIPMCPPGEHAQLVKVNGVFEWECVPNQ
jgi:hypothetical protein